MAGSVDNFGFHDFVLVDVRRFLA